MSESILQLGRRTYLRQKSPTTAEDPRSQELVWVSAQRRQWRTHIPMLLVWPAMGQMLILRASTTPDPGDENANPSWHVFERIICRPPLPGTEPVKYRALVQIEIAAPPRGTPSLNPWDHNDLRPSEDDQRRRELIEVIELVNEMDNGFSGTAHRPTSMTICLMTSTLGSKVSAISPSDDFDNIMHATPERHATRVRPILGVGHP